jgi:oligosaccharide repeat unit polymerase
MRRVAWPTIALWTAALAAAALAAWFSVWSSADPRWALIAAMIVVTVSPFVVRAAQRKFDPFDPILIFGLGIAVAFVARPITELSSGMQDYAGYFTRPGFNGAMTIVLVGTASLYVGYALPLGRRWAERARTPSSSWDVQRSVRFAVRLLILGAVLYLLNAAATGGIGQALEFFIGRGATSDAVQSKSSGWLYLGPYLTLPASLLFLSAWQRTRSRKTLALFFLSLLIGLAITVPRGDRTYVLALILPLFVLRPLRAGRRPRLLAIVVGLLLAIVAINFLQIYRNVNNRAHASQTLTSALTHPFSPIRTLLTGPDVSFFSVLELQYEVQPRELPFDPGATPLSILAGPIPSIFWKSKPQAAAVPVTIYLFYQQALVSKASNDPAMFGDMYADDGYLTVVLYSLLIGIALRAMYVYLRRHERVPGAQLAFASSVPLMIILLRGALTDTIARSIVLTVPLLVAWWVCSRPPGQRIPRMRPGRFAYRRRPFKT